MSEMTDLGKLIERLSWEIERAQGDQNYLEQIRDGQTDGHYPELEEAREGDDCSPLSMLSNFLRRSEDYQRRRHDEDPSLIARFVFAVKLWVDRSTPRGDIELTIGWLKQEIEYGDPNRTPQEPLPQFMAQAQSHQKALLSGGNPPFSELADRVNYWIVATSAY